MLPAKEMEITRKHVDEMLIASIRFRGKLEEAGRHLGELERHCKGLVCGPSFCLYYYDTAAEGRVDIEVCVPVSQPVKMDYVKNRVFEGGEVLSILHHGPYDKLSETYKTLFDYIRKEAISVKGTEREIYLEWNPDDPEKYVTEIQVFLGVN